MTDRHLVRLPDGRLARYSGAVGGFTAGPLSRDEMAALLVRQGATGEHARREADDAMEDRGLARYRAAVAAIRERHGEERAVGAAGAMERPGPPSRPPAPASAPRPSPSTSRAASTDSAVLRAAATLSGCQGVSATELARVSGVTPTTARASVARLRARGEWPHAFPVADGRKANGATPARSRKVRRAAPLARPRKSPPPGSPCPAYLLHSEREARPVDAGTARAAAEMLRAAWRRGPNALILAAYSGANL
jgi:hypothetical protein